jgi:chemotaxis protein MotA
MNLSSLIGIVSALIVLVAAIVSSSKSQAIFLNAHGILIVLGGTAAAALMCFPFRFYFGIAKIFAQKFLGNYSTRYDLVISELVDLARGVRENPDYMRTKLQTIRTPFLADALQLLIQGGIPDDAIDAILIKRAVTHAKRYDNDVGVFRTIAKFPPAFGLMGTTLGMIALLQQLGSKDAFKLIGPAMAMGLVATFYGLAMINRSDETVREIVIDGLRLVRAKEHPKVVEEHLKSYLLPNERAMLKKVKI